MEKKKKINFFYRRLFLVFFALILFFLATTQIVVKEEKGDVTGYSIYSGGGGIVSALPGETDPIFVGSLSNNSLFGTEYFPYTSLSNFTNDLGNPFNQVLNTTSGVTFDTLSASVITATSNFAGNLDWSYIQNAPIYLNDTFRGTNYSTFLTHITWNQATNGTLMQQANWNATNISYYLNSNPSGFYNFSSGLLNWSWTTITNGTLYLSSNTQNFISWLNATNGTLALNSTLSLFYPNSNPNSYYNITTAPIYLNDTFRGTNYTNFTTMYGYIVNQTSGVSWATIGNGSLAFWNQVTNGTMLSWSQALNGTLATWAEVVNGTVVSQATYNTNYSNFYPTILGKASWADVVNGTVMSQATFNTNYTTNDPVYRSFVANYSTFLTHITWANAVNGTLRLSTNNTFFGIFNFTNASYSPIFSTSSDGNISFDNNNFFWDNIQNHVGIKTISPQNELNVVGDANVTTFLYQNNIQTWWINQSTRTFASAIANLGTNVTGTDSGTLLANKWYNFDCKIVFSANKTASGIRLAMNSTAVPTFISYTIFIPTNTLTGVSNSTSTIGVAQASSTTAVANTNYTARLEGTALNTANFNLFPTYGSYLVSSSVNVSIGSNCRYEKVS